MAQALPAIGSGLGIVQSIKGANQASSAANKAGKQSADASKMQLEAYNALKPFLAQLQGASGGLVGPGAGLAGSLAKDAAGYSPQAATDAAVRAYDAANRDTLQHDVNAARLPTSVRGFTGPNSQTNGMVADTLNQRANARSKFVADAQLSEFDRGQKAKMQGLEGLLQTFGSFDPSQRLLAASGSLNAGADRAQQNQALYANRAGAYGQVLGSQINDFGTAIKKWRGGKDNK